MVYKARLVQLQAAVERQVWQLGGILRKAEATVDMSFLATWKVKT